MNLDVSLAQLETADLVRRTDETELAYKFRHALTQDSAYALLLIDQAIQSMETAIHLGAHIFPVTLVITRAELARLHGDLGDVVSSIELGRLALNETENRLPAFHAWTAGALGHVYILADEISSARAVIQRALEKIDLENSNPFFDGGLYLAAAELALAEQDYVRADTMLSSTLAQQ